MPFGTLTTISESPLDPKLIYIGTDLGAYISLDIGGTWPSLCNHLPTTFVYDMVVHPRDGDLVIGTHGRSVFILDLEPVRNRVESPL